MKHILLAVLSVVVCLASVTACAPLPETPETQSLPVDTAAQTEQETLPLIDYTLNLPQNLRLWYQENCNPDGHIPNIWEEVIYKIGDDYMTSDPRGYNYYHWVGGMMYEAYRDENDGSWTNLDRTYRLEDFFPFAWPYIELEKWYETDYTAVICGITCREYHDQPERLLNLSAKNDDRVGYVFVNKELGIVFERGYTDTRIPVLMITEWDTSVTSFPENPPAFVE